MNETVADRESFSVGLTARAAARVRAHLERRDSAVGLRIGVRKTGCSGYSYTVDYAEELRAQDAVADDGGVRVIVDREYLPLLRGVTIDYVREGLNEKFVFTNPNAGESCGCGESFSLKS